MAEPAGIDEKQDKDRGYDPFKESENDDNRDIISEKKEKEDSNNKK